MLHVPCYLSEEEVEIKPSKYARDFGSQRAFWVAMNVKSDGNYIYPYSFSLVV